MKTISEKIKQTLNIPKEYLSMTPPVPKSVKIEITSRCDLKCYFCVVAYKKRVIGHINKDLLYRLLNEIKDAGVKEVGLFWLGEPFLNDELSDYIAYAKKIGIPYVFITTNGRLASIDKLKRVFGSGLDSIKFSINAKNKEDFIDTCGVDAFDQVINHIQLAYAVRGERAKPSIFASTVFDPKREKDYGETDALISPFVDEHYKLRLYGDKTFSTSRDEVKSIVDHKHNRSISEMLPCWSLFTIPHISYNGFMSACYCDFNPDYFMADLKKVSFIDAWHSKKFMKLREKHLEKDILETPCQNCKAYQSDLSN
jgi:MoaA/NifB/PqqE/SkfB family radical SAM enzyme